ncbi:MAG: hypothetical protein DRJ59_04705 [Thermoprotei archaeon]|nr:MAG: hypothetical protein DRJ59_04705 [Thermoprotei archaeon]
MICKQLALCRHTQKFLALKMPRALFLAENFVCVLKGKLFANHNSVITGFEVVSRCKENA